MDNDDLPIGRILSRREVLGLFGMAGAGLLLTACGSEAATTPAASATTGAASTPTTAAAASTPTLAAATAVSTSVAAIPACVVQPEVTEGPYYVDEDLLRSDIRSDPTTGLVKDGTPLALTFAVVTVENGTCVPMEGATVEIWHCDAAGSYSDVSDPGFDTTGQKWLRGEQVTDAAGNATFTTIYPGWYSSRAVHIHFKIRPDAEKVFTSQIFFDDALSDEVLAQAPYAAKGQRDTLNSTDSIYLAALEIPATKTADGYAATFPIGIDMSTIGTGQSNGGPGGPPPSRNP